jgi:hypothetical protein
MQLEELLQSGVQQSDIAKLKGAGVRGENDFQTAQTNFCVPASHSQHGGAVAIQDYH